MKTTSTLISAALVTVLGIALALPVSAQPGPGMGSGPGMQNGQGYGQGRMGHGGRGMRFNQDNTPGWSLMTPAERDAQRAKMREVKTLDECKTLQAEHRTTMEIRAKEKGVTLRTPRQNVCENMQARGFIK